MLARLVETAVGVLHSDTPLSTTIRMQAAFEAAYSEAHAAVEKRRRARARRMQECVDGIRSLARSDSSDIAALSALYKAILAYVTAYLSTDPAAAGLKASAAVAAGGVPIADVISREITAAMESVFPRVGVKQFTELSESDRVAQLDELAHLVLGIRLFNWSLGKGGVGIEDVPKLAGQDIGTVSRELERALGTCNELIAQYADVLLALNSGAVHVPASTCASWPSELANRRQLAVYASSLLEEARTHAAALEEAHRRYTAEMEALKRTIGSRSSVSKDVVYPHFHNVAAHWLKMAEIKDAAMATSMAMSALSSFTPAAVCTLPLDVTRAARAAAAAGAVAVQLPGHPPRAPLDDAGAEPERLSLEHSPEFLQLPLEYQGYCPVALSAALSPGAASPSGSLGILIAGDPAVGVVRWRNRHVVCCNEDAMTLFMQNPEYYTLRALRIAAVNFELVHLLQLLGSHSFTEASLPALIQYDGDLAAAAVAVRPTANAISGESQHVDGSAGAVRLGRNGNKLVDAAVETPVHFVERHIDPRYRWNEWDLRRQALQIMNLRGCKTISSQTDASHFRRDNETQVYEPREVGTQTGISVATNTVRTVRYFAGLRGTPETAVEAAIDARTSKARAGGAAPGTIAPPESKPVSVVTLTLDYK